jgi:hypothetical protein
VCIEIDRNQYPTAVRSDRDHFTAVANTGSTRVDSSGGSYASNVAATSAPFRQQAG